jgi:hypothetical protein
MVAFAMWLVLWLHETTENRFDSTSINQTGLRDKRDLKDDSGQKSGFSVSFWAWERSQAGRSHRIGANRTRRGFGEDLR